MMVSVKPHKKNKKIHILKKDFSSYSAKHKVSKQSTKAKFNKLLN